MEEQNAALAEQTIGEEFARQLEKAHKQVTAEAKMTADLTREKLKAKRQDIKRQEDYLKTQSQAPETISAAEQFKSLGKGDIAGVEDEIEEPAEPEEQPTEGAVPSLAPTTPRSAGRSIVETLVPAGKNLRVRKEIQKQIREINRDIKNITQEIGNIRGQLRPAQSAYYSARSADTMRVIKSWLKIVGAAYITIIFGIILTLISMMVVPLLLVIGATGILPSSSKSKKLKLEIDRYRDQIKLAQKKLAAKNMARQTLYRQLT